MARRQWDTARRNERVPTNTYGGTDYTAGLEYWVWLRGVESLLEHLERQGFPEIGLRGRDHGFLPGPDHGDSQPRYAVRSCHQRRRGAQARTPILGRRRTRRPAPRVTMLESPLRSMSLMRRPSGDGTG